MFLLLICDVNTRSLLCLILHSLMMFKAYTPLFHSDESAIKFFVGHRNVPSRTSFEMRAVSLVCCQNTTDAKDTFLRSRVPTAGCLFEDVGVGGMPAVHRFPLFYKYIRCQIFFLLRMFDT